MAERCELRQAPSETLRAGKGFKLKDCDRFPTPGYAGDKSDGEMLLDELDGKLAQLQEQLFAESRFGAPSASSWSAGHGHCRQGRYHHARHGAMNPTVSS